MYFIVVSWILLSKDEYFGPVVRISFAKILNAIMHQYVFDGADAWIDTLSCIEHCMFWAVHGNQYFAGVEDTLLTMDDKASLHKSLLTPDQNDSLSFWDRYMELLSSKINLVE